MRLTCPPALPTPAKTDSPARLSSRSGPAVTLPLKFGVAFPIVYHTLGGFRHLVRAGFAMSDNLRSLPPGQAGLTCRSAAACHGPQIWDYTLRGIDNQSADTSSKALLAVSFAASAALAATTL